MCELLHMDNSIDSTSSLRTITAQTSEPTTDEQASFGSSKKICSSKYFLGNSMGTKWKEWTKSRENSGAVYPFIYIKEYRRPRGRGFSSAQFSGRRFSPCSCKEIETCNYFFN